MIAQGEKLERGRRRITDRLVWPSTVIGLVIIGFAIVLKFRQPATSDTLVIGLVGIGAGLIPSLTLLDRVRSQSDRN